MQRDRRLEREAEPVAVASVFEVEALVVPFHHPLEFFVEIAT